MDIKDFILIGGGLLIALVVAHGFWIAWLKKREPLRLDIVPDLIPEDVDEIERLRGELPNGGARVIMARESQGRESQGNEAQASLPFDTAAPVLMTPAESHGESNHHQPNKRTEPAVEPEPVIAEPPVKAKRHRPLLRQRPAAVDTASTPQPAEAAANADEFEQRPHVREVVLETEKPKTSRRRAERQRSEVPEPVTDTVGHELLVINVLSGKGSRFGGEDLINALRAQGLRYGDMNIFHRVEPTTKAKLFSVANAVEPGTFDIADLDGVQSPGISFFLNLPGPDDALMVFEDMVAAARGVATELDGELRDEQLSVLTGQTVEHMRQRISDFTRRRLSMRA